MSPEAWLTVATIGLVIAALASNRIGADVAMMGGLTLLMASDFVIGLSGEPGRVLPFADAIRGFAHPAILMIGALFVVAAGLQETGGVEVLAQKLLGRPRTVAGAQLRLMVPVAAMSAFMNNTPIVAMYLPIVGDWARKLRISPSKLFMPLSYAAILGGKITLVGSASNITTMLLFVQYLRSEPAWLAALGVGGLSARMQFWGIAALGIPVTIVGIAFIVLGSRRLLPERKPADPVTTDARRYEVQMVVRPDSPIVGKTIEEAGLRQLPGLFLTQIERDGDVLPAVSRDERLRSNDRLAFAGILESVVDLRRIRGLVPATDQVEKVAADRRQRTLVEAVVSHESPLVGRTVRESRFRTVYNAAIIAVHRQGRHVNERIGDIVLEPGDTLLLDTHSGFLDAYRNSGHFYLVSRVEGTRPIRHERAWLALGILGALVVMLTAVPIEPVIAAFLCAGAMVATRCVTGTVARGAVNWQVLIVIAGALGMGEALTRTGAAAAIAHGLLGACKDVGLGNQPAAMAFVVFLLAAIFSQLVTNNGAAVLMFPITMVTAQDLGVSPVPFVFVLIVAAGSSFMSPAAYQTNLMVWGPGGYRFTDFLRMGAPLTVLVGITATLAATLVYAF